MADHSDFRLLVRFLARVAGKTLLVLAIPALATIGYVACLRRTGELLPASAVAALSASTQRIIWLTGYYDTAMLDKVDVTKAIAPQVVVLGSSRMMEIRTQFFAKLSNVAGAFYNVGGCCQTIGDSRRVVHALASVEASRRPKLIILGIDSWWFQSPINGRSRARAALGPLAPRVIAFNEDAGHWLSGIADRVQTLQIAWRDPRFQLAVRTHFAPALDTSVNALLVGVTARSNRHGYRNDGSVRGPGAERDELPPSDSAGVRRRAENFRNATVGEFLSRGASPGPYLLADELAVLDHILGEAESAGIAVIVLSPPLAPASHAYGDTLTSTREFRPRFRAALAGVCERRRVACFDFADDALLPAVDDDFIDWLHPGERLIARVMVRMFDDPRARPLLDRFGDPRTIEADLAASSRPWLLYDF